MLRCGLLGHRFRFTAEGRTMAGSCARGCGAGGTKSYPTPADATCYATALDRTQADELGHRAPLGLFPLRIAARSASFGGADRVSCGIVTGPGACGRRGGVAIDEAGVTTIARTAASAGYSAVW